MTDTKATLVRLGSSELTAIDPGAEMITKAKVEAAVKVVNLLIAGGETWLREREAWGETERSIAGLDAETARVIRKMDAELLNEKEKTRRLDMMLAHLRDLPASVAEAIARSIGKYIESSD